MNNPIKLKSSKRNTGLCQLAGYLLEASTRKNLFQKRVALPCHFRSRRQNLQLAKLREVPDRNLIGIYEPPISRHSFSEIQLIKKAISEPVGIPSFEGISREKKRILVLVDDNTRRTPLKLILPYLIAELMRNKPKDKKIKFLFALGTHRLMTPNEMIEKLGKEIVNRFEVINHKWDDKKSLTYIGTSSLRVEIWVNKEATKADLIIGLGHIVPHSITGFSGGGKIVVPGICGENTVDHMHWASTFYQPGEIFGKRDNPIRAMIDNIAIKAGLSAIINVIQDSTGKIVEIVSGDPVLAHRRGCAIAKRVYGVKIPSKADIVIVDSFPCDIDLRQAIKGICTAESVVRKGGIIILVSPCFEGIAPQFEELFLKYGFQAPERIKKLVIEGKIKSLTGATTLFHIGSAICKKAKGFLVSPGVKKKEAEKMGFHYFQNIQAALDMAFTLQGKNAQVLIIKHGGEVLPIL